jgi:hypothetical protein
MIRNEKMKNRNIRLPNELADGMIETILERTKNILLVKAKEYTRNGDRLHNFNVGAEIRKVEREKIIEDYRFKHEVSRLDMIKDMEEGIFPTAEQISEKYGDIINYFILEEMSMKHKVLLYELDQKSGGN